MGRGAALEDVQPGIDTSLDTEVRVQLDRWRHRYRHRVRAERRQLLLFALEREQIVTVAYREEVLAARIEALDVPDDVRRLLRRALAWVWRDEALHVDWVRGQLRHELRPVPVAVLLTHQATGLVGGWISTTRLHPRAGRRAADLVARALVVGARATGQIGPDLARALRGGTFRAYAELNVGLERTAERCWLRLGELAGDDHERHQIARIAEDEARHRCAFAAIAAVLDDHDRLRPGADADLLASRLAAISPWLLPAERRDEAPAAIGRDLPVHVVGPGEGAGPPDDERSAHRAAVRAAIAATGVLDHVRPGAAVAIRTAFMIGYDRRDRSNVIDPDTLDAVAEMLRQRGAADVAVLESPTVYDRYVEGRSVAEVAAYFGYDAPSYRIVDAEEDQAPCDYPRGLGRTTISATWRRADLRVVLAQATTDPVEHGHLCLCTLEGTGGRVDQTIYLGRYTDFRSATMMVLDLAPPDLAVVDAWGPVADGPVGVMGSHRPCHPRRVYAGADAIAVDLAALDDMGAPDPHRIPMLAAASQWLGTDLTPPRVHGPAGRWGGGYRGPGSNPWNRLVCRLAFPMYTYGGAQGARFVPRFDRQAFPDRRRPRWDIRLSRWAAQRVFGLHPPAGAGSRRPSPPN